MTPKYIIKNSEGMYLVSYKRGVSLNWGNTPAYAKTFDAVDLGKAVTAIAEAGLEHTITVERAA